MRKNAVASRPGLDLFEHELSFVRRRVVLNDPNLPTLIVLPDGPATIEHYDSFIETLSARFNIVLIEIPGLGFSYATHPDALSFEGMCKATAAAIADLSPSKAVLVGPCVQGLIALRVAQMIPDHLSGLIIAQTADIPGEKRWIGDVLDANGQFAEPYQGQIKFRYARDKAAIGWWTPFAAGPHFDVEAFSAEAREGIKCGNCHALATLMQKLCDMDEHPLHSPVPTTIIWGMADASYADTNKRSIQTYAPDARYLELEGIGHFTDLEAPLVIAEEAEKLLAGST